MMLKDGLAVYSPIVHCHELAKIADLPRDAAFWRKYNFIMLTAAESVGVLMLPGWEQSVGIDEEVEEGKKSGIKLLYIEPKEKP